MTQAYVGVDLHRGRSVAVRKNTNGEVAHTGVLGQVLRGRWASAAVAATVVVITAGCWAGGYRATSAVSLIESSPTTTMVPTPTLAAGAMTPPSRPSLSGPNCLNKNLALEYRSGGLGTGNDFGGIVVRNTGPAPCLLTGSVKLAALDAHRRSLALFRPLGAVGLPPGLVLSANAPPWIGHDSLPPGVVVAFVQLMGGERDNPNSGQLCTAADEVTPVSWQVEIPGGRWVVANRDSNESDPGTFPSLEACLGDFNVIGVQPVPS